MPTDFSGKWTLDKPVELTTEMLDKMQIPAESRPNLPMTKLDVEITQDGDNFIIHSTTAGRDNKYSFVVGTTFEASLVAWMPKMKVQPKWDGDRLIIKEDSGFKMTREIIDGKMVTTISKGECAFKVHCKKAE